MSKNYANEHPKYKKKNRDNRVKVAKKSTADEEFNEALYEEIKLEEKEFNEWVRENNKRIREKNKK